MKATLLAAAALVVTASAAIATTNRNAEACPTELSVRHAATRIHAKEVVPLLSGSGRQFLMLVLGSGQGLVVSRSDEGCYDTMLAMPKEVVAELLTLSQDS